MQVIFSTNSSNQNRFSISQLEGYGKIYFHKGVLTTTDKDLIKKLLNHKLYERGTFKMVTNEELVSSYLDGKEPDKLTEEILDKLSLQGVKDLGEELSAKSEQPSLIKAEIVGRPITNGVRDIIDYYTVKKDDTKVSNVQSIERFTSKDMTATEAVKFIEKEPIVNLEDFLDSDEERKTVLEAYNKKIS